MVLELPGSGTQVGLIDRLLTLKWNAIGSPDMGKGIWVVRGTDNVGTELLLSESIILLHLLALDNWRLNVENERMD